jgi:bifunctional enzyme CysN/CysC
MKTLTTQIVSNPAGDDRSPEERSLCVVITGHVDHGKSTVIGRLLADTGSLPEGRLEQIRSFCARNARPFEYAFLLDALKDERAQGITIDSARVFFQTAHRRYTIVDAPGHVEFLRNMVTGASRASAALIVIDAKEGIKENSRRHGYLLSMLGIGQVIVLINKMDLVDHRRDAFDALVGEFSAFLEKVGIRPLQFIPVAAQNGDNIAQPSARLAWFTGPTVLEALDALQDEAQPTEAPLRMPVQGVYKFTELDDTRRIVAGTIDSGTLRVGDEIVFYPSGKKTTVTSIEGFNRPQAQQAAAGEATGFTIGEQVYVSRGEIVARANEPPPCVTTRLEVNLFWLGKKPLVTDKDYLLKLGTARVTARVSSIDRVLDASRLEPSANGRVERHQVARCVLDLARPLAFDLAASLPSTGRFVLVDDYEISGGGIVLNALADRQSAIRGQVLRRNAKWDASHVSEVRRAQRYSQRPLLLIVTGSESTDRKGLARECEARLFDEGRFVYFLGMGNLVHGVDADLAAMEGARAEHIRRMAEVANILLDAGLIVIAAAAALSGAEVDAIRTAVGRDRVSIVWVGPRIEDHASPDLHLPDDDATDRTARIKTMLQGRGFIFSAC